MKTILTSIAASSLLAALAIAQPRYTVHDLGALLGSVDGPYAIKKNGLISGAAPVSSGADHADHAVLWRHSQASSPNGTIVQMDIGTPGLGGPNSIAYSINDGGQAAGVAETLTKDSEDFCGFAAIGLPSLGTACVPFVWQNGVPSQLPTLGGANGQATAINIHGEVAGFVQTNTKDPNCPVHDFKPVVWQNGTPKPLGLVGNDREGFAFVMNDNGQVAGASGNCRTLNPPVGFTYLQPLHAMLWQNDGTPVDLGNLGGTGLDGGLGSWAIGINNLGQVVGSSERGDGSNHAFLWTKETSKMRDLGTLPGNVNSGGIGINDGGQVVGISLDATGFPSAFHWQPGLAMTDLNTRIPADSPFHLLAAVGINSGGEIIAVAFNKTAREVHGVLLTPGIGIGAAGGTAVSPEPQAVSSQSISPEDARSLLHQGPHFGRFGAWLPELR
jgi:probable HAF family extracellular repeat protein